MRPKSAGSPILPAGMPARRVAPAAVQRRDALGRVEARAAAS